MTPIACFLWQLRMDKDHLSARTRASHPEQLNTCCYVFRGVSLRVLLRVGSGRVGYGTVRYDTRGAPKGVDQRVK